MGFTIKKDKRKHDGITNLQENGRINVMVFHAQLIICSKVLLYIGKDLEKCKMC